MNESGTPYLSVVIPTYRDAHCLRLTLQSLARQTLDSDLFEVIVVGDGSLDETYAGLDETAPNLRLQVVSLERRSGRASARNRGIELAEGEVVVFLDSDSYASKGLLAEHLRYHERATQPSVLAGARYDLDWPELSRLLSEPEVELEAVTAGMTDPRFPGGFDPARLPAQMETPWLFTFTNNASVPRATLEEIGRSDEQFGSAWGFEDTDLFYRLYLALGRSGAQFGYSAAASCAHLLHFRNMGAIRHGTAVNGGFIRRKHQSFEIELGVYPPPEISERIRYYRRAVALCQASKAGRVAGFPELYKVLEDRRTLCSGFGGDHPLGKRGSVTFDHSRPLTVDNRHLLGIRTQFEDRSFEAAVSIDIWRFMPWEDFCRFVAESFRVADRLYLAYSHDTGLRQTDLSEVSMIDDVGYLTTALAPHVGFEVIPCAKGLVLDVHRGADTNA
ncbi:glycosyltransferase family 2 protein [Streptomyces sp. BE230]|uniref:glycosyltransferase family 2 protein n=1 Tax=Streptomyces sp. BE230 TaxID=3002526 RepID=UPI002ED1D220|nr:glycosyltransferase family 2 protein [Streptomyces sp. BE230]